MGNISISSNDGIYIVNIDDNMDIYDYDRKIRKMDKFGVADMLTYNVLLNCKLKRINKGIYYIFQIEDSLYNVFVGDYIAIDETYKKEDVRYERIINYSSYINAYRYQQMEHDESGSTSNIKYYDSTSSKNDVGVLSKKEASSLIDEMLTKLIISDKIKNIIDLELMKENILYSLGGAKTKSYGGRRSLK